MRSKEKNVFIRAIACGLFMAILALSLLGNRVSAMAVETVSEKESSTEETKKGTSSETTSEKETSSKAEKTTEAESTSSSKSTEKTTKSTEKTTAEKTSAKAANSISLLAGDGVPGNTVPVTVTIIGELPKGATISLSFDSTKYLTYATVSGGKTTDGKSITVAASTAESRRVTVEYDVDEDVDVSQIAVSAVVTLGTGEIFRDNDSIIISKTEKTETTLPANYGNGADPHLDSLKVTGYTLSPAFDEDVTTYKLNVKSTVTSIDVKATCDSDMSYRVSGASSLGYGENVVKIVVTSTSGMTKTYTILVNREGGEKETTSAATKETSKKSTDSAMVISSEDNNKSGSGFPMWVSFLLCIVCFFIGFGVCYAYFVGFKDQEYYDDDEEEE